MKGNKNDGLFVNAKIHNTEVHCLIDTGSTMSVLHTTVFDQLPGQLKKTIITIPYTFTYGRWKSSCPFRHS